MRHSSSTFGDFRCAHCQALVSSAHLLSGVNNRNHCPYCLWSSHLDLFAAGDRLSACKAPMRPIGLTMKKGRNKYQREPRGELMLVHECTDCKTLSINRIAADDDSATVMAVFEESLQLEEQFHTLALDYGIVILRSEDRKVVQTQLYGHAAQVAAMGWR
ncbi:MAG TPA: RNHCP domain-containing protein [Anaerolineales bacterium]|nr:RNHCP domain-containing protein [Anaerolineales bacterium]